MNNIPKDEYYCTNLEEKKYLNDNGIKYTFVKSIMDGRITTVWKYYKSSQLFKLLEDYYK